MAEPKWHFLFFAPISKQYGLRVTGCTPMSTEERFGKREIILPIHPLLMMKSFLCHPEAGQR